MEKYKARIQFENKLALVFIILCVIAIVAVKFWVPALPGAMDKSFAIGAFSGMAVALLAMLLGNQQVLKNEAKLKEKAILMNDERNLMIEAYAGRIGMKIATIGLIFGAIISSLFNKTIAVTLLAAAVFALAVMILCQTWYKHKF